MKEVMKTKCFKLETALFTASLLQCGFVLCIHCVHVFEIDLYHFALTGAIYEMITLPVLASIFLTLPIYGLLFWRQGRTFVIKNNIVDLMVNIGTISFVIYKFWSWI